VQRFKGVVIRRQGDGIRETFTVRKESFGVGVERTFPVHTPVIEDILVVTRGDVRRAKLYYLRELAARRPRSRRSAPRCRSPRAPRAPLRPTRRRRRPARRQLPPRPPRPELPLTARPVGHPQGAPAGSADVRLA
jgi:hypothetical protein